MPLKPIQTATQPATVGATAQNLTDQGVTVPEGASWAEGFVRTASVVENRHGSAPTATLGHQWDPSDTIVLRSRQEIDHFQSIRQAGANAAVDWDFFNGRPD